MLDIMRGYFARSLDRPIDIFGLKGGWITVFLALGGGVLFFAFLVGFIIGSSFGIAVFIFGIVGAFFYCLFKQSVLSYRQLNKLRGMSRVESYVIRRESISRALYENRIKR